MVDEFGTTQGSVDSPTDQARRIGEAAKERALGVIDHRRTDVATRISSFADKLDELGRDQDGFERTVLEACSGYLHGFANDIEGKSADELLNDVADRIRRRPGLFFAGLAALGFLGGRLARR